MTKEEIAHNLQFLLLPQCFPILVIGYLFNYRNFLFFDKICSVICCRIVVWGKGLKRCGKKGEIAHLEQLQFHHNGFISHLLQRNQKVSIWQKVFENMWRGRTVIFQNWLRKGETFSFCHYVLLLNAICLIQECL